MDLVLIFFFYFRRRQLTPRSRQTADSYRRPDSDQDVLAWSMRRLSAGSALSHAQLTAISSNASLNSKHESDEEE